MTFKQTLLEKWNRLEENLAEPLLHDIPIFSKWKQLLAFIEKEDLSLVDALFAEQLLGRKGDEKCALFLACLFASARQGHLCLWVENPELLEGAAKLPEDIKSSYLHSEGKRWYLKRNWDIESLFIEHWKRLQNASFATELPIEQLKAKIQKLHLEKQQQEAIIKAATTSVSLICGGPGTGKTYTAAMLLMLFMEIFQGKIIAAAPTGKAAANLREKLSEACEVHTLQSALNRKAFLTAELILIDEASMVDAKTMALLFSQVPTGSRLVMLGDPHQLPPVETGNLFADLMVHPKACVTELTKCLRTDLQEIVDMAARIKEGSSLACRPLPDPKAFVRTLLEKAIAKDVLSIEEWLDQSSRFQTLSPLREGPWGVDVLNQQLFQAHCLRSKQPLIPILITENHTDRGLFNGDVGVLSLHQEEAFFSGGRCFPSYLLPKYEWAYLLSVHKSQGSEYDEVILVIPEGADHFGKEVLYTAVTRAKKKITLFGHTETLERMLKKTSPRFSGLSFLKS